MAQQQPKDGPKVVGIDQGSKTDDPGRGENLEPGTRNQEAGSSEATSVTQIWDLVRKSTDVIVALREENAILRNELYSLRKSEAQLQDRLEEFLNRIETLERGSKSAPPRLKEESGNQIDRLEDSLKTQPPTESTDDHKVTITITINDNQPRRPRKDDEFDGAVRDIVDAVTTAIKTRMTGS